MTTKNFRLGSISHGTMRHEDLIPCFMDALLEIDGKIEVDRDKDLDLCDAIQERIDNFEYDEGYYKSEDAEQDLKDLFEALEECAPPYVYFGVNEGDGSNYGFWIDQYSIEEDCRNGELATGPQHPERAEDGSLFLEVDESWKMTLYRYEIDTYDSEMKDWVEVWSCV